MQSDCHPVRDKAPGPHNHQLCAKHGHIVDIGKRMIIAESVLDYKKRFRDELTKTAKTVGAAAVAAVGAVPGGKAVIAAAEGALAETTKLPRPIQPDCKLVPLKGGAPENIYLCTAHGHIIDVKQTAIIANDRKSYEADAAGAKAVGKLVEKVVGVVKEGMAAAKEQAAFEAAARKRAELDKAVGVVPVAISLLVEGPDGPVSDLDLVADAMADGGVGEGTWYGLPLRETSAGVYVGEAAPLPPTGILAIGQAGVGMGGFAVQTATFDPLRYTAAAHGVLHLTATENPGGAKAKLRHFEVKIAA
jgi:hypothetical protein